MTDKIELSASTMKQLHAAATARGITPDAYLQEHLLQDWRDQQTQRAMDRLEAGETKFVDHEELMNWMRSRGTGNELPRPKCK